MNRLPFRFPCAVSDCHAHAYKSHVVCRRHLRIQVAAFFGAALAGTAVLILGFLYVVR